MRKGLLLAAAVLFGAGLAVLAYPHVCQWEYDQRSRQEAAAFVQTRETDAPDTRLEELYRMLVSENERLSAEGQDGLADPFAYEQPAVDLARYGLADNRVAYLDIPAIGVVLPVYLGASEQNMALGAVHLTGTSYPVGGTSSNAVIAAHRGFAQAAMFRDVENLSPGDMVEIENFRETLLYRVVETQVVDPDDLDAVLIRPGCDLLTLSTCHPYGSNEYRFLVVCERVAESSSGELPQ